MIIEDELYLDYSDVLIRPKWTDHTSRQDAQLTRTFKMLHNQGTEYSCVPIIASNMHHTGTREVLMAMSKLGCPAALSKHLPDDVMIDMMQNDPWSNYLGWWTIGMGDPEQYRLYQLMKDYGSVTNICLDVANGYTEKFADWVTENRKMFPHARIMAGNVATPEMVQRLLLAGADIVKIGIGPGSVCTTRTQTGVGVPQLSAVIKCADTAHGLGGLICADGGCTTPGDVAKAFGAGADFVMLGGMLAGHDECVGNYVYPDGTILEEKYSKLDFVPEGNLGDDLRNMKIFLKNLEEPVGMQFYGMASKAAQENHGDGLPFYTCAEGKEVVVPYKESFADTMQDILGGLRASMSLVGARNIKDMSKCTTFIRVNNQINTVFGS